MATREKVREFLRESESHEHYSSIVEYALTYFIARAEREGNARFAEDLRRAKAEYHEDFGHAIVLTEEVYAETFTDEELDELILLHGNATLKKARALTADIMNQVLAKYLEASAST